MTNPVTLQLARDLRKASNANDAPIWKKLSTYATKPSVAKRVINVNKIAQLTKDQDTIVFPGKILGTGNITHKITVFAFSVSNTAADKILGAGGKIVNHHDIIKQNPTGKGVLLLG